MIACPDCGLVEEMAPPGARDSIRCALCNAPLERSSGRSVAAGLACALATLVLLIPGNVLLLMHVGIWGMHNQSRLSTGIVDLGRHGWWTLAFMTGAFAVVLPFLRFGLASAVLAAVRMGRRPPWLGRAFRWAIWLDVWGMPDVYLVAGFIGYFRLSHAGPMRVGVDAGGWCFLAAAMLAMLCRASVDRRTVWRAIAPEHEVPATGGLLSCTTCDLVVSLEHAAGRCPRCRARLHARRPRAVARGAAFTLAALVLFFPANILPMNTTVQMGRTVDYTIFQGVRALFDAGLWPLGLVIFSASILIPALKIGGMAWLLMSVRRRSRSRLVAKTSLHRMIYEIGRWSNVDPFTITVFVPLMTFGPLASSTAGWGATAFIAVVVLTLLATMSFDPRLLWDAPEEVHA